MPRPRKEVDRVTEEKIEKMQEELAIWDQIFPLIFNGDNLKILLILKSVKTGLSFSQLGRYTKLGVSQKLADRLNYLARYGLVQKANGNYELTPHLGQSFAELAYRIISLSGNIEILKSLEGLKEVLREVDKEIEPELIKEKEILKSKME